MASRELLEFLALLFIVKSCTCSTVAGSSSSSVSASTSSSTTAQSPFLSNGHYGVPALITPIANEYPILSYNNIGSNAIGGGYYGIDNYAYNNGNYYPNQYPIIVDSNDDDRSFTKLLYLLLLLRGNGNNGCGNNGNCGCGGGYGNCGCNGGQDYRYGGNNGYNSNYGCYGNNCGCSRNGYDYTSSASGGPLVEVTSCAEDTVLYPGNTYSYCEPREINLVIRNESCGKSS